MKKLFPIISMILCISMLAMGVSAAGTTADEDPYEIFNKCMDKMSAASTVEMKSVSQSTYHHTATEDNPPDTFIIAGNVKLVKTPGNDSAFQSEYRTWYDAEYLVCQYTKDGCTYNALERVKTPRQWDMRDVERELYVSTGMIVWYYERELPGLSAKKLPDGGYILRYKVFDNQYTLIINKDYSLKSRSVYRSDQFSTFKYQSVFTINEPITIDFPHDLDTYKTDNS